MEAHGEAEEGRATAVVSCQKGQVSEIYAYGVHLAPFCEGKVEQCRSHASSPAPTMKALGCRGKSA